MHAQLQKPTTASCDDERMDLFKFLIAHCVRTKYVLQFKKDSCSVCSRRPVKAREFMTFLNSVGGHVPVPKKSELPFFNRDGEQAYDSFGDRCLSILGGSKVLLGDDGLPSMFRNEIEKLRCAEGCNMYFYNAEDMKRHFKAVHDIFDSKVHKSMQEEIFPSKKNPKKPKPKNKKT